MVENVYRFSVKITMYSINCAFTKVGSNLNVNVVHRLPHTSQYTVVTFGLKKVKEIQPQQQAPRLKFFLF